MVIGHPHDPHNMLKLWFEHFFSIKVERKNYLKKKKKQPEAKFKFLFVFLHACVFFFFFCMIMSPLS